MKNTLIILACLAVAGSALLLGGCASTPTHVDTGTIKAKTFSFVNGGEPPAADFADNRREAHIMIQQALTDDLNTKGLTKVPTGGDVIVAYLVILGNNVGTESINTYFGYGRDAAALQDKAHKAYTSNKSPNYFQAGTLVVDIIDAKSFKLLRRNYVTRPVLQNPAAEVRETNIREAVNAVLKDLKVEP